MTPSHTPNGSTEHFLISDYQKRNLLLRYIAGAPTPNTLSKEVSVDKYDDSRLAEFRQLKREIRGSTQYLVVGIDIAKERHYAFFGTPAGKTLLHRLVFDNTKEGFDKLCFQTDILKEQHGLTKVVFGMEPTADYHKPLGEYLVHQERLVVLVLGNAVKNNRELIDGRWDKNDTKDAANVADLVTQGKCLFYEFASPPLRELRSLLSLQRRLKKQEQGYRVRTRNHLIAQYFPELDPYFGYSEGPAIARWCLDPDEITTLPFEEFARMVSSGNGGEKQWRRLREIRTKAASSIGCEAHPSVAFEGRVLVEEVRHLQDLLRETSARIREVCQRFPEYFFLLTIPGFGPDTSAKVLGAIGDPHRFENHRQVLKTAGLDLSADRSGKRQDVTPVISKKGKADLRYGLYQAALIASTRDTQFMTYFAHKLKGREKEKGIGTKMRVKLAAKMLVVAWTLMKKKEKFDPGCLG
jgi:transposase